MQVLRTVLVALALVAVTIAGQTSEKSEAVSISPNAPAVVSGEATAAPVTKNVVSSKDAITIPQMMSYQGRLTDAAGVPVANGDYRVEFRLYPEPTGGSPFWTETQTVTTRDGLFSILLGSVTPITTGDGDRGLGIGAAYIGMSVESSTEMAPRLRIAGTYANSAEREDANRVLPVGTDDTYWVLDANNVLWTAARYGLVKGGTANNKLYGIYGYTQTNFGASCTTGASGYNVGNISIGGGYGNRAWAPFTAVCGGRNNKAGNEATDTSAIVVGGYDNRATAKFAYVGGGRGNTASGQLAAVGGGDNNVASGEHTVVAGGEYNTASGPVATVAGGQENQATDYHAFVGGGCYNTAGGSGATATGGYRNVASYYAATVAGGDSNVASRHATAIGGGYHNAASGDYAFVGGGSDNTASGRYAAVTGGYLNAATGQYATVGGNYNTASGMGATVCGGGANAASALDAIVGGGTCDTAKAYRGGVFTGFSNLAGDAEADTGACVVGGYDNSATGPYAFVGGGEGNTASLPYATSGGGYHNSASGHYSVVGGGAGNVASGYHATVGGGGRDTASYDYATVPGGYACAARGIFSLAAGRRAKAAHSGSFVWGDATDADFASTANNQFLVRANGGVGINKNNPSAALDVNGAANISGNATVGGKFRSQNEAHEASNSNSVSTTSFAWVDMPTMTLTPLITGDCHLLINFVASTVGFSDDGNVGRFRLLVDDTEIAYAGCGHDVSYTSVVLMRMPYVRAGQHTVKVQWSSPSGNTLYSQYARTLTAVEF